MARIKRITPLVLLIFLVALSFGVAHAQTRHLFVGDSVTRHLVVWTKFTTNRTAVLEEVIIDFSTVGSGVPFAHDHFESDGILFTASSEFIGYYHGDEALGPADLGWGPLAADIPGGFSDISVSATAAYQGSWEFTLSALNNVGAVVDQVSFSFEENGFAGYQVLSLSDLSGAVSFEFWGVKEGGNPSQNPEFGVNEIRFTPLPTTPPSITGTQSGQTVDDNATIDPFTSATIVDPDDDTLTVIVSLNNANKGELTNLGGFVEGPSGTYTFVGSPATATTTIRGLTFNPTENRRPPGNKDTTRFTISADDGIYDPVTDDATTVIATSINDPPTISGTVAGQTVDDNATIDPFTGVTIADPDKNAQLTVTVTLDNPAKGVLTNLGGFVEGPAGTYTYDCSPSEATTTIQGLTFDPTPGRVPVGQTETTTFTISADDSLAAPVTDNTTTVITTAVEEPNTPPSISGTVAGQTVDDNATIDPFTTVTISDPDTIAITVTVSLDNSAKGDLVNLGSFVEGPLGTYTFTGSPAEATTAIRALTFDPTEDRVPIGQDETTTFTISADDGIADPVTDDTTTVIVTVVDKTKKIFLPLILR